MASDRKKGEMTAAAAAAAAERAEIEAAQKAFVPPPGYKRSIVPMTESRSCMYDYGVRVEEIEPSTEIIPSSPKRRKISGRFFCMASKRCREQQVAIKVSNMSTSPASDHLNGLHGVLPRRAALRTKGEAVPQAPGPAIAPAHPVSSQSASSLLPSPPPTPPRPAAKPKKSNNSSNNTSHSSNYRSSNSRGSNGSSNSDSSNSSSNNSSSSSNLSDGNVPVKDTSDRERALLLNYIKTHTILGFAPLDFMDSEARRNSISQIFSFPSHPPPPPPSLSGGRASAANPNTPSPVDKLRSSEIKRGLVEMYDATKGVFAGDLEREARSTPVAPVHLSVDRWTAYRITYIGVRASYLTKDFRLRSHLLAAKQYMPRRHETHSGSANNHGDGDGDNEQNENGNEGRLIRRWVEQALWEFGLDWSLVLSAVVDGSPEMRAAFRGVRGVWTESCISHVLSGVIVSGFGLSRNPRESSNPAARAVVMSMRRILENVRCSSGAQAAFDDLREEKYSAVATVGPRQAAARAWESSAAAMERLLVLHEELATYFAEKEGRRVDLNCRDELLELYSLLKSVTGVMGACQSTSSLSAPAAMQRMLLLLATDLNITRPLELHDPSHYFSPTPPPAAAAMPTGVGQGNGVDVNGTEKAMRAVKKPHELTEVGRQTRAKVREEAFRRFGLERWGKGFEGKSHLFDMVLALHPGCRQLQYMEKMSDSPDEVIHIKAKVWRQIQQLVEGAVKHDRAASATVKRKLDSRQIAQGSTAAPAAAAEATGSELNGSATNEGYYSTTGAAGTADADAVDGRKGRGRSKRMKLSRNPSNPTSGSSSQEDHEMMEAMASAGLCDPQSMFDSNVERSHERSPAEEAEEAVRAWRTAKLPATDRFINTGEGLAEFWREYGSSNFSLLSVVARSVLGVPGCAAVAEHDFTEVHGGWTMADATNPARVADAEIAYGEVVLFLRAAFRNIPENVPRLSAEQLQRAIPRRLCDPKMREELRDMGAGIDALGQEALGSVGVGLVGLGYVDDRRGDEDEDDDVREDKADAYGEMRGEEVCDDDETEDEGNVAEGEGPKRVSSSAEK